MITERLATIPRNSWFDGLPPPDCWIRSPQDTIETPVDSRGLVDYERLVAGVRSFIHPEFLWPDNLSDHHLYWTAAWYRHIEEESGGSIPAWQFRELPSSRLYLPRMFHTVLHHVTIPPLMPDPEVMRYQIAAWRVASNLFTAAAKANQAQRRTDKELAREYLSEERLLLTRQYQEEKFARYFTGLTQQLDALERVPSEYWLFDPYDEPPAVYRQIGRIVNAGYQRIGAHITHTRRRGRRRVVFGVPALATA